jgi:hypothetical protein
VSIYPEILSGKNKVKGVNMEGKQLGKEELDLATKINER